MCVDRWTDRWTDTWTDACSAMCLDMCLDMWECVAGPSGLCVRPAMHACRACVLLFFGNFFGAPRPFRCRPPTRSSPPRSPSACPERLPKKKHRAFRSRDHGPYSDGKEGYGPRSHAHDYVRASGQAVPRQAYKRVRAQVERHGFARARAVARVHFGSQ